MPLDILAMELKNCRARRIVMHSDLTILGRALPKYKGVAIERFQETLNTEVLAVPTFNLNTNSESVIDFSEVDASMGALPTEAILALRYIDGTRLPNPIHSYTFFPSLPGLNKINSSKSFGARSVFSYFYDEDFYWVEFGTNPGDGLTIFHHLECLASVPYREKVFFHRSVVHEGNEYKVTHEYYANKEPRHPPKFAEALDYLVQKGVIAAASYGGRNIFVGSVREIADAILDKLSADAYFLVREI